MIQDDGNDGNNDSDDTVDFAPIDPYVLPKQEHQPDHPSITVPKQDVVDSEWDQIESGGKSLDDLLIFCHRLWYHAREPQKDQAFKMIHPQLTEWKAKLECQQIVTEQKLNQIYRFLGIRHK